jgi:SET domain
MPRWLRTCDQFLFQSNFRVWMLANRHHCHTTSLVRARRACAPACSTATPQLLSILRRHHAPAGSLQRLLLNALPLRGWVDHSAVETRPAKYGRGVFALRRLRPGEFLGEYPGVLRSRQECKAKCERVRTAYQYVFQLDSGRYVDPTVDETGALREDETCCLWGGFLGLRTDAVLARVNEAPAVSAGGRANVAAVELDGTVAEESLLFGVLATIEPGEEVLIRYGVDYDRSGYDS